MFTIVLTGGLGAGKSTAAEFFRDRGATVIDLDAVGHGVLSPGAETLAQVADEFGADILRADGSLDRAALAQRAFASPAATARLNAIVHPAIAAQVGPSLADVQLLPFRPEVMVLEVPLLAEAPVYKELADVVIAVSAPEPIRIQRAVAKGMAEDDAVRRISAQASDEARTKLADIVIENAGDRAEFIGKLERFWHEMVAGHGASA